MHNSSFQKKINTEDNRNENIHGNAGENKNISSGEADFKGKILGNRFRLVKTLGKGGMSTVYLAENINLGTFWAIKQISRNVDTGLDILIEPKILKKLNHPSLPRIIDIIEDNEYLYIVQDFIEGNPLDKELERVGKFPINTVLEWSLQICDVLIYLHEFEPNPIIYRDMKPGNIILTPWNEIKLVDFGIAREYKKGRKNDTVYIGTRGYAAPEQYGDGQSSINTDIYCFGVTLFQLITGKLPQELYLGMKLPGYYTDGIPSGIEQIISKCTRFNPEERYSNARELKNDILNAKKQLIGNGDGGVLADRDGLSSATYDTDSMDYVNNSCMNYVDNSCIDHINDSHKTDNENNRNLGNKIYNIRHAFFGSFHKKKKANRLLSYKSAIFTVWDNTEFACELAYVMAKSTNLNILLADIDLLCPAVDLMLNIKKYPERIIREGILNESGLNIVLDSAEKGNLTRESFISACIKRKEAGNLYILTGNYRLENYEYYSNESLTKFIDKSSQIFDIVILTVNKSIYDAFTAISLIKSDLNIIPVPAVVHKLREFNNYIVFLKDKQKIPLDKNKFVAYEYDPKTHLSTASINEATQYNYLGSVRFCNQREKCRNQRTAYTQKMDKKVMEDYLSILRKIKILP